MERLTSQKKIILDYLKSVRTHPSAEEIFEKVRKRLPQISLGTVYRILKN
ncbi:transcriptional repressor, partial [Candidatus Parcubacteria bacterium]|nr:transcriptional repressor [Candidatus Parcubacteria bacterium]